MPATDRSESQALRRTPSGVWSAFWRYALAVVLAAMGLAARFALEGWVGSGLPTYVTFYPPVMAAALLGVGPGLLATALLAGITPLLLPPIRYWAIDSPVDRLGLALFCGMSLFMIYVAELTRRYRAKAAAFDRAEALRVSEERYRLLVEQATDGIFVADAAGRYIDVNTSGAAMFGYTPAEIRRLTIAEVLDPAELARVPGQMSQLASGNAVRDEWQFRRKDGSTFIGELVGRQLPDGRLQAIIRDITERKRAEELLRESQAQLRSEAAALVRLNEASSRLWAIRDLHMGLGEVLAAAIDLLGADMGNIQLLDAKRGVLEIAVHRGFKQDYLDFFREISASDDAASGRALRSRRRVIIDDVDTDSAYAPYRTAARAAGVRAVQSTPLIGRDGAPLGTISTHSRSVHRPSEEELRRFDLYARQAADFIERYRIDETLRQGEQQRQTLQAELFHASRLSEIGRMAAAFAHELNQPLTAVATYIGGCRRILASGTGGEQRNLKLQEVMEQAGLQGRVPPGGVAW
jgi:PAS domain S-box-containing protein